MKAFLFCLSMLVAINVFAYDTPKSWIYYQDPPKPEPKKEKPEPEKKEVVIVSPSEKMTAKEILKKIGEDYEEKFAIAVLNPSRENILAEMAAKKKFMDMSEKFANSYQQVIWKTPEFDYTLEHPMRTDTLWANGKDGYDRIQQKFAEAATRYGLLYVFRSDCPYCKKFSPVLKLFANAHGFSIISVSLDGQGTQDFPNPVKDLSLLKRRNALPEVVPALYLIDPKEPQAQALGFGIMNSKDLEERIAEAVGINLQQGTITASKLDVLD